MAETLFSERRKGMAPQVQGLGGGSLAVNWNRQGPQSTFEAISQVLGKVLGSFQEEEQRRQEKMKKQVDMYKVLRESGYDPKGAYEAVQKNQMPKAPSGETLEEEEKRAEIGLKKAKSKYYEEGGSRRTVIDRMTPNQLQARLKFLYENPSDDPDDLAAEQDEIKTITERLRKMTEIEKPTATESPSEGFVIMTGPDGKKYKIPRANIDKAKARGFTP